MEQKNSTTIGNEAAASSSNNISIPQLTDARKQEIRKKLLERQRQARLQNSNRNTSNSNLSSSNTPTSSSSSSSSNINEISNNNNNDSSINNTDGTININSKSKTEEDEKPPNKEMIKKAVAFLSSPKVQSAPTSRKHSFLLSKGCTKKEIELAEKEIEEKGLLTRNSSIDQTFAQAPVPSSPISYNSNNSQGQTPPPLPPRNYQSQNIQIVYRNPPLSRGQKVQRGLLIIIFGGVLIKGISVIVKREILKPLRALYLQYTKYLKSRNNVLNKYMLQVIQYCALFINDKNKGNAKHIKTIEEIEKEKKDINEKESIEHNKNEEGKENDNEKEEGKEEKGKKERKEEGEEEGEGEENDNSEIVKEKPKERKAIKLKIHRKKEETTDVTSSSSTEETQLVNSKKNDELKLEIRTLSAALQDYINNTNSFELKCKDAIDTYAYDLERNSDLFSGTLGQTMKLSSEVYQIVSREMYYNSSSSSSFYVDPYQSSDKDNKDGPISLYARVNNIKSEIRRLKGMLLNHRNFPKYKQRALANGGGMTSSSSPINTP